MPMNHEAYSDAYIRDILARNRTIAMVGASRTARGRAISP